ncbi:hypothetical protein F511_15537 [Dorcoceras hygrometricum]|uniref:Uncharacterized protein n=1 Tax=Dorcoceras hygrometricum TaxID=472368 RepID=A0A2Z7ADT7_9LAMI|nr:hypothetical protein F511_15537 [Dorcoceras hygrometricum]
MFEGAVTESFANTKVIEGTIVSFVANRKMVITKDVFAEAFGLPTEGLAPNKKKDMKMEYRFLHDIVAKALCAKTGSFDVVTSEKFDLMVAISTSLKSLTKKPEKEAGQMKKPEKAAAEKKKKKEKVVSMGVQKPVEARSQAAPAKSKSETSSDADSRPLAKLKKGGTAPKLKLICSSYASIYKSRLVSIEAKQDEPRATSLALNNGGNRRQSNEEGFGEQ